MLIGVCVLAALRALRIIPLEFTFPIKQEYVPPPQILFNDFYNQSRYSILADISFDQPDGELRYNQFGERLIKPVRKTTKASWKN